MAASTPMIDERSLRYLKEPRANHLRGTFVIDALRSFEKDVGCQILSAFAVADPAIDIAKDQMLILLIHSLKARLWPVWFHGGMRGFCLVLARSCHVAFPAQTYT